MINYDQFTLEQLNVLLTQESKKLEKLTNEGVLAFQQVARITDIMETIGYRYIDFAEKMRKGEPVDFE
ncbi:hypothetical protein [Carnobacterium mobile]|uniref:hypothetical protein n=1 Tax=Carnobacterium mobile TaxID=2750 RepID=UPI000556FF22|nr:hypothetical protein [Carnobacterium mobile]